MDLIEKVLNVVVQGLAGILRVDVLLSLVEILNGEILVEILTAGNQAGLEERGLVRDQNG